MIPQKITKKNYSMNNKKRKDVISLKKKKHKLSNIIESVLKLNIDGYEKKLISFSKSTDFHKKLEKNEDSGIISNPLLLSTSISQVQRFLPNINILLNTESNFNYNPSRQEHIKFEEKIKKEISFYTKEEKDLREKLSEAENQLINLENKIVDCKIDIQALKSLSVSNTKSPLRRAIAKKLEDDLNIEENKYIAKSYSPLKVSSPKKLRNSSRQGKVSPIANSEFNTRLNIKLMEEEKKCKEKEKTAELNITKVTNEKENEHKKLNHILEELKIVNNNKKVLIDQLYKHYLSLLKEGKDSRKEGLAWIIMEIFYLNKKILASNFPRYLDNDCIHYLFKMANLNIKIIQLENQVKNKRNYLNNFIKNYNINNYFMKYFYDDSEDNPNNYEYNKKQLSSLISTFSTKFNKTKIVNNGEKDLIKEKLIRGKNISITEESNNSSKIKEDSIFKTSKTNTNINFNNKRNNKEESFDYLNKNSKKRIYRINEFQNFFDQNNKENNSYFKGKEALKSNEYQIFSNLSNELFSLKQEKDRLKLSEMDRIFKEFQKNDYKQRYQVEKKTVISALIGEDNLESELFKQAKREKEYLYKMNKIQLFQNKYQGYKSFH